MAVGVTMASRFIDVVRVAVRMPVTMRLPVTMVFFYVRDDSYSFLIVLNELNYP